MFGGDLLESKYRYVKSMEKVTIWRRPIGKQIKDVKTMEKFNVWRRPIGKQIKSCKNF